MSMISIWLLAILPSITERLSVPKLSSLTCTRSSQVVRVNTLKLLDMLNLSMKVAKQAKMLICLVNS